MTNHLKIAYLVVIAIFLAGVLCLWNDSIQNQKYQDIVACWQKEMTTDVPVTGLDSVLCNMLYTHKLQDPFIGPFSY
jgi:hypothetical protein